VAEAHAAGVRILAGTDAGSTIRHGRIADEILALHQAGLPMAAALDAACWAARAWLGADGLAEGARADLVVCRKDPRAAPETIRDLGHVVLGGRIVR
jgi:imidazolonepropionase-like amidohydrolase